MVIVFQRRGFGGRIDLDKSIPANGSSESSSYAVKVLVSSVFGDAFPLVFPLAFMPVSVSLLVEISSSPDDSSLLPLVSGPTLILVFFDRGFWGVSFMSSSVESSSYSCVPGSTLIFFGGLVLNSSTLLSSHFGCLRVLFLPFYCHSLCRLNQASMDSWQSVGVLCGVHLCILLHYQTKSR